MTEDNRNVHSILKRVLMTELDPYLKMNGFTRDESSLEYVRRYEAGEQHLEMNYTLHPKIDTRADSRLYPWIQLRFPEVNQIALKMVDGELSLLGGSAEITLRQPLDIVIPNDAHVYWFTYGGEQDFELCVRSIQGYIEEWVMPFLDEYTTIASLANFFQTKDERILAQRHFYIYVAAAYILLGQPARAMEVLESNFGKAGPRRDYAKAFAYVEERIK